MKILSMITILSVVLSCTANADIIVQDGSRAGHSEFRVFANGLNSSDIDVENLDSFNTDSDIGLGFGYDFNYTDQLSLGFTFTYNNQDFDSEVVLADNDTGLNGNNSNIKGELDNYTFMANGTYYFMEGKFTPYIGVGVGWTWLDSNVIESYDGRTCWFDPYWGTWVCGNLYDTYDSDGFTYAANFGLRYDVSDRYFVKAEVQNNWSELSHANGTSDQFIYRIAFGWVL